MKKKDWEKFDYDEKLHELSWEIRAIAYLLEYTYFTGILGLDRSCQGLGRIMEKLASRVKSISLEPQKIKEESGK